ncbi:epoxide hydrolase family protein [Actinosynnema sp. NPDC050436]|uniref:epoxide hydrolase family protein n=1 Tax=Actinosynnema sp. NPDC050436 TaxID=3155659 RepID=UPI0033F1049B
MDPFRIEVPETELADLRQRLTSARWPAAPPDEGWDRGVPPSYLRELAEHWRATYDWRAHEARLNELPQFTTAIDGVDVHFLHVRSPEPGATPLLLTHGWPGSFVEFSEVVGPLADPVAHGGAASDAFHVVVPSLPGHGFSGPAGAGWDYPRVARAWAELMDRLGYGRYLAHGGDHGAFISLELARLAPERVLGAHVNMLLALPGGDPAELAGLTEVEQGRLARLGAWERELSGYMKLQATKPTTLGYALTDSPIGQLAWIAERFKDWTGAKNVPEEVVDRDHLLTDVSVYWFTRTAATSAQAFYDNREYMARVFTPGAVPEPVRVPIGVLVLGEDIAPVRRFAERDHPSITWWTEFEHGGHFASMEQPGVFVDDLRGFAATLR